MPEHFSCALSMLLMGTMFSRNTGSESSHKKTLGVTILDVFVKVYSPNNSASLWTQDGKNGLGYN